MKLANRMFMLSFQLKRELFLVQDGSLQIEIERNMKVLDCDLLLGHQTISFTSGSKCDEEKEGRDGIANIQSRFCLPSSFIDLTVLLHSAKPK
ncbi:CLUMA_CG019854, isoform A [Clunio marinus]|uniref:CLUMA_CG019854, isoform A n=1 Tax=Clunio marinus TaxID=568069 RepID=A0A1J1J3S6_9DIPT|nr:CLUMA_CG019854, isoform A [Clunio marinus]